jgi:tRNA nucleotidyltransferase (CCA-adding enzyme)
VTSALLDRLSKLFTTVLAALEGERGVWVVGGAVRDLLLGREPRELDLVVEGDAVPVARRAAARLGGDVLVHDRFGTATVRGGGIAFDLAGARRETYPRPGALPEVSLGATLAEDLARRDFTVNTLALRLVDGALTSFPGAEEDLAAGLLRVLHDGSFRDDPTRLLRMARYGGRLGFAPEPRTAGLAEAAVAGGALRTVTGERLGAELRLLAREPQPAALQALGWFGVGAGLLPGFDVDPALLERALAASPDDAREDVVALGAAVRRADPGELAARLRELGFPAADAAGIVACAGVDALVAELAGKPPSAADVVLRRRPLEAAVLAAAAGSGPARDWLERGRHERLAITGDDLLAAGLSGPAVGRALQAARAALLDGSAPDRDTQLTAALAQP